MKIAVSQRDPIFLERILNMKATTSSIVFRIIIVFLSSLGKEGFIPTIN